jgi:hypothetical protein
MAGGGCAHLRKVPLSTATLRDRYLNLGHLHYKPVPFGSNDVHASSKAGRAIHWIWDCEDVTPCRQVQVNRCFEEHSWTSTVTREVTWHKTEFSLCLYILFCFGDSSSAIRRPEQEDDIPVPSIPEAVVHSRTLRVPQPHRARSRDSN